MCDLFVASCLSKLAGAGNDINIFLKIEPSEGLSDKALKAVAGAGISIAFGSGKAKAAAGG